MKSSILVIGAADTIGRDVAKQLSEKDVAVRNPFKARKQFGRTLGWRHLINGLLDELRPIGNHKQSGRLMKTLLAVIFTVMLACASSARAQTSQPTHKPSTELQKEGDYYVGNWKLTGDTKTSPFGPGGKKFASSERLEWIPGGFFLLARSYQGEKWAGLTILGYDENKKIFTHTTYNASGEIEVMEGTEQGDSEIWSGDGKVDGKPVKQRLTIKRVSPTLYTFKFEMAPRGGDWSLVYEGQGAKEP
jgi:hypothetical protein